MNRGPKPGVGSRDFAPLFHDVHLHPQIAPPQAVQPSSLVLGIRELWVVRCLRPAYDWWLSLRCRRSVAYTGANQ